MGHLQNIGSCPKLRNVQTVRDILKKWCLNLTYLKLTEQNGPTWPKMAPRWHQDAPRWPQDVPKMAARRSSDGSKLLQEAARAPKMTRNATNKIINSTRREGKRREEKRREAKKREWAQNESRKKKGLGI